MLYYLYSLATAPGVVVHEFGHLVFCLLAGVKVHRLKLFGFGQTAGYVIHDEPAKFHQSVAISFGPLLLNSLLTLICFSLVRTPLAALRPALFLWLGAAIGLHAIPSTGDARTLLTITNGRVWKNPFILLGYPFVLFLYLLNWLRRLHLDFIYVGVLFWLGWWYLKG